MMMMLQTMHQHQRRLPAALPFRSDAPVRYLLGEALLAGLLGRFIVVGAVDGGICGRGAAAPVVMP